MAKVNTPTKQTYSFWNQPWSERTFLEKAFIGAGVAGTAYLTYKNLDKMKRRREARKDIRDRRNMIKVVHEAGPLWGDSGPWMPEWIEYVNLNSVALNIWTAFYDNDFVGFTEDEETAVDELLKIPREYIPDLAAYYFERFDENLFKDFRHFLATDYYMSSGVSDRLD